MVSNLIDKESGNILGNVFLFFLQVCTFSGNFLHVLQAVDWLQKEKMIDLCSSLLSLSSKIHKTKMKSYTIELNYT